MKKNSFLLLLLLTSVTCFSQRSDPYFHSSRIIKSLSGSLGEDYVGYFFGQILLDSSSKLLTSHIGKVNIKSVNVATLDSAIYHMDDDSGHFTDGFDPGFYDYTITKAGYQPLIIKGFHSYQSQELYIKAVLEPGNTENVYVIDKGGSIKRYVPPKPSYVAKFYYGNHSDTTIAFLWGQVFLNTISPGGDSSIGFGKVSLKYRCTEAGDTGIAQADSASKFAVYFKNGHYIITISSAGYQSVVIKNYYAFEGQESYLDAVLEPGNDESVFNITKDGEVEKER